MRVTVLAVAVILAGFLSLLEAQRIAIYLTDGGKIVVSEYETEGDRIRYFSVERAQWEEIPKSLVDLERTREVNKRLQEAARVRKEETERERRAERRARTELHQVPLDDGVYHLRGNEIVPLPQAALAVNRSKMRTALKILAPAPVVADKETLAVEGLGAELVTAAPKPIFYMRLERFSRFGIVRVKPEKKRKRRVVQIIEIVPQSSEKFENQEEIEVFRQQLAPLVYKIWPVEDLPPGEYALIDFTPGESDLRVWDFSHDPAAAKTGS